MDSAEQDRDSVEQDPLDEAERLIDQGEEERAAELLRELLRGMPRGWSSRVESERELRIAFWTLSDFIAYARHHAAELGDDRIVSWDPPSYAKARYLLARISEPSEALEQIEAGLALEPAHPRLHVQRGAILRRLERLGEARAAYERALALCAPWQRGDEAVATRCLGELFLVLGEPGAEELIEQAREVEASEALALVELLLSAEVVREPEERGVAEVEAAGEEDEA